MTENPNSSKEYIVIQAADGNRVVLGYVGYENGIAIVDAIGATNLIDDRKELLTSLALMDEYKANMEKAYKELEQKLADALKAKPPVPMAAASAAAAPVKLPAVGAVGEGSPTAKGAT